MVSKTIWIAIITVALIATVIGLATMDTQATEWLANGQMTMVDDDGMSSESSEEQFCEFSQDRLEYLMNADLDSDGIPNCEDIDDDADGINDSEDEYPHDHDNDGLPDAQDDDDDNDGILDVEDDDYVGNCPEMVERPRHGRHHRMRFPGKLRPVEQQSSDLDSDGVANCEDPDDDGDGINDTADEYPHDHDNDGIPDGRDDDDDNDGIPDAEDDYYVGNCSDRSPEMKDPMRQGHQSLGQRPNQCGQQQDRVGNGCCGSPSMNQRLNPSFQGFQQFWQNPSW